MKKHVDAALGLWSRAALFAVELSTLILTYRAQAQPSVFTLDSSPASKELREKSEYISL